MLEVNDSGLRPTSFGGSSLDNAQPDEPTKSIDDLRSSTDFVSFLPPSATGNIAEMRKVMCERSGCVCKKEEKGMCIGTKRC